jgi:hypothetical protein
MIPFSFKVELDKDGRWIRGLELLGGSDFNLERAVKPFHPKRPSEAGRSGVTYDEEANAAFFYFSMKTLPTPSGIDTPDFKYSHSITPEARFGLDEEGGLVWTRFRPEEANANVRDFVSLIEAPVEDTESG